MIKNGEPYTATQVAEFLGLSRMQVSRLYKNGTITRLTNGKYPAKAIAEYCEFSRGLRQGNTTDRVVATAPDREAPDTNKERARLLRAQADKAEMDNEVRKGELAPIEILKESLTDILRQHAAIYDSLPGEVKRNCPELSNKGVEIIKREVAKVRNIAADARINND